MVLNENMIQEQGTTYVLLGNTTVISSQIANNLVIFPLQLARWEEKITMDNNVLAFFTMECATFDFFAHGAPLLTHRRYVI